jgi:hypothetical protein
MNKAASALGISRRTLIDTIKDFPQFEYRGSKKMFYPEHIATLRREMHRCASKSNGPKVGHLPTARVPMVSGSDALSKLKTLAVQKSLGRK